MSGLASKRDTFWATRLDRDSHGWRIIGHPGLVTARDVTLEGVAALIGDRFLPDEARARCESSGIPVIEPRFEAGACLAITRRMLAGGETADPLALTPLYPREPEAVSLWESRGSGKTP